MAWMMDTYSINQGRTVTGVVTGKPVALGGSLGRREATGRGVAIVARAAMTAAGSELAGATVVIQGFGNVGGEAARALSAAGARIVAVTDATGGLRNDAGIDVAALTRYAAEHGNIRGFPGAAQQDGAAALLLPCDLLVPAAAGGQITRDNAAQIGARMIAEGANGPTTPEADAILARRGIQVLPDILCNAGGVFVSYLEYTQETQQEQMTLAEVNARLEERMRERFALVRAFALERRQTLREAAMALAVRRAAEALEARGSLP
jgi:glutamate dehydrogenase (NAD(P)+)